MAITITVPADTKTPGTAGHTSDHNLMSDALTTLGTSAANTAGDTFSGSTEFDAGVVLGSASPSTPASGKSVLYSVSGVPTAKLDSTYAGAIALGSAADHSSHTATATTSTAITATWTIPANDANAGTLYRLTYAGFGTWGSTAQDFNGHVLVNGTNVMAGGGSGQVAAAEFAISTGFWIRGVIELLIVSTGAGGTMTVSIDYTLTAKAKALTGTAAQNTVSVVNMNSVSGGTTALDTTSAITLVAAVSWGSTTGAPTITGSQSFLERFGA